MPSPSRWRFGPFEVDALEHQLRRDGEIVPVTRKSFALLATLLSRPGKLFTKVELFEVVWAGTVVTDAALSRAIRELRVALGDDAAAPRYIATAHGLGFRFVALVSIDRPVADPSARAAALERRFVGRDSELALLDEALAGARAGRRQTVFVTGEAGIGKTTLVEAFLRRPEVRADVWTTQGRCIEQYGTGEAYLPILEALEHLAREVGADRMREVLLRYAPAWLAQLPWLAHDTDAPPLRGAGADGSVQRMLREIAQVLEVLAAERPIVLWLEDLHWSDPSSLAVIAFLAGRREQARLLLIASFRPADAHDGAAPLHGLALQLAQRGQAMPLALGLLDEAAVARYLRARFDNAAKLPFVALAAFLHRRTDGNALFTVAMVDDLVRSGHLVEAEEGWALRGSVAELGDGLPDDLRHLVHAQIERLDEDDRRLVEAAAVAGTDFSAATVAAALGADVGDAEDRCLRLAQQGRLLRVRSPVTWPDATVASGFGFLHALYWQGAYERVPPRRRADWHEKIGLRQEQAFGPQCAPIAAELAMRFEAARDLGRTLRYLQMAASSALSRCAYQECIELMKHALSLVPQLPAAEHRRGELELLLTMGVALMASQGYASGDVEATYQRALVLCDASARPGDRARVLRGLWNVAFLRANLSAALGLARELLQEAEALGHQGLVFDAHTMVGQCFTHLGNLDGAREHLERALALPVSEGDLSRSRGTPRVAAYLAWVLWFAGYPAKALECAEHAMRSTQRAASPHSTAIALGYVSWLHVLRGDMPRAIAMARQLAEISAEHGLTYWRLWADFMLAKAAARPGASASAGIAAMRRAIDDMRSTGGSVGIPNRLCALAEAELICGTAGAARQVLAEATSLVAANDNALFAAEVMRLEGETALADIADPQHRARAEDRFRAALDLARRQGARSIELRAATSLAALWREDSKAARAVELLAPIHASFSEGFDTADLARAKRLLDDMAQPPS